MKVLVKILTMIYLIVGLFFNSPSFGETGDHKSADAKDRITVVVNLTKDKGRAVDMSFNFISISLSRGNETILWLNSNGVKIARADSRYAQNLKDFISKGGKVYVCPICAKKANVDKLVEGAELAKPDEIFSLLSKDRVRVISW